MNVGSFGGRYATVPTDMWYLWCIFFCFLPVSMQRSQTTAGLIDEPCPVDVTPNVNGYTMDVVPGVDWMCCMCPKGTYMSTICKHHQPRTRVCTNCTFDVDDVDQQYFTLNHSHTQISCNKSISTCPDGLVRVPGNTSYPAKCIEQPITVDATTTSTILQRFDTTTASDDQTTGQLAPGLASVPTGGGETGRLQTIFFYVGFLFILVIFLAFLILACGFPRKWDQLRDAFCSCFKCSERGYSPPPLTIDSDPSLDIGDFM